MCSLGAKVKEKKNKGKGLPKLKTILANPKRERCPALDEKDLQTLKTLLNNAINNSGLKPLSFATASHVHLGLESSLRAINNSKCSCVLISHSIKPMFLIRLIARNAEAKNERVPVYVQTQLEDFAKEIFGIRALAIVLPTMDEMGVDNMLGNELIKWVMARTKQTKPKPKRKIPKVVKKEKRAEKLKAEIVASVPQKLSTPVSENTPKQLEGDFIALSDAMVVDKADSEEDAQGLTAILRILENNVALDEMKPDDIQINKPNNRDARIEQRTETKQNINILAYSNSSDSDEFLPEIYQPLTVHKIQPNPNKKPKKKRPKKSKQNKK
ncbi:uncharacterized protein [Eurosta solidaginis]|uniref:uncharacterized protein n=1 Tax=Eurosta solidaginis TaxID=178769 RepID=UPI003530F486